jgi:dihydroflavonol-4-reductase
VSTNPITVLITGGNGFIGSHVINRLASSPSFQVVAIVRKTNDDEAVRKLKERGVLLVEGDFYNASVLDRVFAQFPVSRVIHLAAICGEGKGKEEDYLKINVRGTEALLDASLKKEVKRFIYCSSVGVFGTIPSQLPGTLRTPLSGDSFYHQSKILAEEKVQDFMRRGLDAYIVRPTITYGEGDHGFSFKLVNLILKRIPLVPHCGNLIHLLDVEKLAEIFAKLITTDQELDQRIFIVADRAPIQLEELADLICSHYFGKAYQPAFRIPKHLYDGMSYLAKLFGSRKLKTSLQLISSSWYYDVAETSDCLGISMSDTKTRFKAFLETTPP